MSVSTMPELSHDRPASPKLDRRRSRAALPAFGLAFVAMAGIGIVAAGMIPRRSQHAALAEASHEVRALVATPRVKVVSPIRGAKPVSLRLPADLLPDLESPLHARAGGFLKQVLVKIGDRVEAGQLLAEIEAPEMDQELDRTRATVLQATADEELAVARGELASLNLKRAEALSRRGAATAQELDEHRAALQVATATVGSATATVTARKAEVRRLEERISFRRVVAPFPGTITARDFDPGALIVSEGSGQKPLFRIAQDETLKVVVSVPQAHLASVRNGQDVRIVVREFPGRTFLGRVARTARAVDPASRTLRTEIDLPNADRTLYSGMFVEVEFTRAVTAPLTVPANAVLTGPGGARVLVVGPEGRVRLQPIAIGRDLGGQIEVAGGLKGDERLVENPASGFADGARVEVVGNLAERAIPPAKDKS
ncbi:RND family efflux transporter, MFP subunit [Singulisphaera sp. GP187]|uniref:efflux RND transporter periplasmic adaptor subunit n=1 Tax=Singulisphaera sp. GP187 TaxID=1882752 RepID=UPI00092A2F92|nr:efflux RND transporter periplasmic adaptor subunit [Singulisphaera sp. GP187]SIO46317.1 RND family efflux transporter, MFP subunit [Singulisphaera sp. GP187]